MEPDNDYLFDWRDLIRQALVSKIVNACLYLGWYRENTIIPHTTDMDFAVSIDDVHLHSKEFIRYIESTFKMRDRLGFVNESLEFRFT